MMLIIGTNSPSFCIVFVLHRINTYYITHDQKLINDWHTWLEHISIGYHAYFQVIHLLWAKHE
jgi:type IV secretory pathway VirB3-like protein